MLCSCERAPQAGAEKHQRRSIRVHSWGEYLAPDVLSEFERRTGIEVNVSAYEDTDSLVKTLQASPGKFDVVITDDSTVKRLIYMRLLRHLKKAQVPNIERIAAEFLNNDFDPGNAYTMPYMWGTTVVAYRKDLIAKPATSWESLFGESLEYPVSIIHERIECFEHVLRMQGVSPHSEDSARLGEAAKVLTNLANQPRVRFTSDTGAKHNLIHGVSHAAMMYSGDAAFLSESDDNIDFFIPDEGSSFWIDSFVIPRDSDRTDLAHQFINYMQEPKVAAASSNYLRYASANKDASPFIDSSLVKDTRIYPGPEVRAKCAFLKEIGRFEVSKVHWWKILDTASKRAG